LLLEADAAAEGGDVVIGGKECDQAKDHSPNGLDGTDVIQAGPGALLSILAELRASRCQRGRQRYLEWQGA